MTKEKVNHHEVHDLYQICIESKDFASSVRTWSKLQQVHEQAALPTVD